MLIEWRHTTGNSSDQNSCIEGYVLFIHRYLVHIYARNHKTWPSLWVMCESVRWKPIKESSNNNNKSHKYQVEAKNIIGLEKKIMTLYYNKKYKGNSKHSSRRSWTTDHISQRSVYTYVTYCHINICMYYRVCIIIYNMFFITSLK